MFAHRVETIKGLLTLVCGLALIAFAGCGDSGSSSPSSTAPGSEPASIDTADADPDDLQVIEDWSKALNSGDVKGAAGFFALPSTAENGIGIKIETPADAVTFNRSLPCGAEVESAETTDGITTVIFRLTERPGGDCGGGAGGTAATAFRITDGKIAEWKRVAPAGGGGGGEAPPGAPV